MLKKDLLPTLEEVSSPTSCKLSKFTNTTRCLAKINRIAVLVVFVQGGKRLGDETSVSEQKGVKQWTGIELGARPKFKIQRSKFKILIIY